MEETGKGVIENSLERLEVFGVSKDDQVGEVVDLHGGVSKVVEEEGGLLAKVDVIESVLVKGVVGEFVSLDYFVTVGLKGEGTIEDDPEVGQFGDFSDGEWG